MGATRVVYAKCKCVTYLDIFFCVLSLNKTMTPIVLLRLASSWCFSARALQCAYDPALPVPVEPDPLPTLRKDPGRTSAD